MSDRDCAKYGVVKVGEGGILCPGCKDEIASRLPRKEQQ